MPIPRVRVSNGAARIEMNDEPLDDIEFLARSKHRVHVLDALADGPLTRPTLHEVTGVPQPTLGRIIGGFQDRGWLSRHGREYALSPFGVLLAEEFANVLAVAGTIQQLRDVAHLLPTDELDFDIRTLGSATVTTPQDGDVLQHLRRVDELLDGARHIRIVTDTVWPTNFEDLDDRARNHPEGDLLIESVVTGAALRRAMNDDRVAERVRAVLELGTYPVYRYDGTIPMNLGLADDVAMLLPTDERGLPGALIETEAETIRAWIDEQFEAYRDRSTELTLDDLPA